MNGVIVMNHMPIEFKSRYLRYGLNIFCAIKSCKNKIEKQKKSVMVSITTEIFYSFI